MKKILSVVLLLAGVHLSAQTMQQGFYNYLPQASYVNPSLMPKQTWHFGIPVLSNIYLGAGNSGFAFKDMWTGPSTISADALLGAMAEKNLLYVDLNTELLTFGFRNGKSYYNFSVVSKNSLNFSYSKGFFELLLKGNGPHIGGDLSLDGSGINLTSYLDVGVNYNREITKKLTIGARPKLLIGAANFSGSFNGVKLTTASDDFALTASSKMELNASSPYFPEEDMFESVTTGEFVFPSNYGFGLDAGASYALMKKLTVYANLVDLGTITWKSNAINMYNDGEFTFGGISSSEFFGSDSTQSDSTDFFTTLTDSLGEIFQFQSATNKYRTSLATKIYLGGHYDLNKYVAFDGLYRGQIINGRLNSALMLGAGIQLGKVLQLKGTYRMADRSLDQIGGGFVLNGGGFVFYMMSDNLLGLTQLDYMKSTNVTFGLQIVPGSPKSREDRDEKRSKKEKKSKKSSDKKKKEAQKEQDQAEKSSDAAKKEADQAEKEAQKAEKEADKAEKALEKAEGKAEKEAKTAAEEVQKAKEEQAREEARKAAAEKLLAEKAALEEKKAIQEISSSMDSSATIKSEPVVSKDSSIVGKASEIFENDSVLPVKMDSLPVFIGDSVPTTLKVNADSVGISEIIEKDTLRHESSQSEVMPSDSTVIQQKNEAVEIQQPIEPKGAVEVLPTDSLEVPKQEILGE